MQHNAAASAGREVGNGVESGVEGGVEYEVERGTNREMARGMTSPWGNQAPPLVRSQPRTSLILVGPLVPRQKAVTPEDLQNQQDDP